MVDNRSNAVRLSLRLDAVLHDAIWREARSKGREVGEHIQRILAEHAIAERLVDEDTAADYTRMWSLVSRAVEAARSICREGGFGPDITHQAILRCMKDVKWATDYEEYVRDNAYKHGNPRKGPINKEIGFRIREGIGGVVLLTEDGKPTKMPVAGSIVQSFTVMQSHDPQMVKK
jgi:hypothetical protein